MQHLHLMLKSFFKNNRIFVLDTCLLFSTRIKVIQIRPMEISHVVHDRLVDEPDVRNPLVEALEALVNVHAHTLKDKAAILSWESDQNASTIESIVAQRLQYQVYAQGLSYPTLQVWQRWI